MTELLEKAIEKLKTLKEAEQDAIAALILEEIEDEARWDESFAKSHDVLAHLAQAALAEDRAGKTHDLDPETLLCYND
jgi:hypothetical protein